MIKIREATTADIPDIAKIHVAGWHGAYGGIVDQGYLDEFTVEMRIEKWKEHFDKGESNALLAHVDGEAVGFVDYGSLKTPPAGMSKIRPLYSSEIYALYLMPEFYRQGVGTALIKEAVGKLKDNKRGCSFYDSIGGQRVGKKIIEIGPTKAKEVCYGWRDTSMILEK